MSINRTLEHNVEVLGRRLGSECYMPTVFDGTAVEVKQASHVVLSLGVSAVGLVDLLCVCVQCKPDACAEHEIPYD